MDKVFPQKFILYLNFKSEDLAKKYKWISKLFLLFFVYAFLADFLISAKLLTSYTFCEGNYIITTSVDCEIASAKETDIFTIKNAFADVSQRGSFQKLRTYISGDELSNIDARNPLNWKIIYGGNIYYFIFMIIWFVACAKYTLFVNVLLDDNDLNLYFNKSSEDKGKPSITKKLVGYSYYYITSPVFIISILALFLFSYEIKNLNNYVNFDTTQIAFSNKIIIAFPKILYVAIILFNPLVWGFMLKILLKIEQNDFIFFKVSKSYDKQDILLQEESLYLEFKSSFQTPYPEKPKEIKDNNNQTYYSLGDKKRYKSLKEIEKLLQDMVLETLVGFLNSSGGNLVIGINEKDNKKETVGINFEGFASQDAYERHVIQIIINRIGVIYMGDYINTEFLSVDGENVFLINVKPYKPKAGQIPALLDGKTCFKRTGPRTDRIENGTDFAEFVAQRISEN